MRASSIALSIVCSPLICAYVVFAACFCPGRLRRHVECEDKKRFERRQKMAPRPLPKRPLQRSLTLPRIPLAPCEKAGVQAVQYPRPGATVDQSQSRLMQLPLELRQMIWRAALGDTTIHVILKERKLGHLRCKARSALSCPLGYNGTLSRECCWGTVDSANIWAPKSGVNEPTDGDMLPLLQTCRQIYSESIDYLYSTNRFSFSDLDCLRYFSNTTLPHRFALIQSLSIEWYLSWPIYDPSAQNLLFTNLALYPPNDEATWEATWRIVAEMPRLRSLRISLLYFDGFRDPASEALMFAPLRKIKVKKGGEFEVHVSWDGGEMTDLPFRLVRPAVEEDYDDYM